MTIQQVKEQGLSAAQQDLIELVEDFQKEGINISELQPQQKASLVILEKRGHITIASNGDITLTEKSKEDTKMATKKVEKAEKAVKVDEKALKAVAKDLNDVLGLEPAIDLKAKDLLVRVKDEAAQVGVDPKTGEVDPKLVAGDKKELQKETWEFLEAQGMLGHLKVEEVAEEEVEEEEEKPVAKKAGKKASVEKAEKAPKVKKEKEQRDFSTSNKAIIFTAWKHGKGETDVAKLFKLVKEQVKESTIKVWLQGWKNGKNLPAIAGK